MPLIGGCPYYAMPNACYAYYAYCRAVGAERQAKEQYLVSRFSYLGRIGLGAYSCLASSRRRNSISLGVSMWAALKISRRSTPR